MEWKGEGVKRRGGRCVDVVVVQNGNVLYGKCGVGGKGAGRKPRCEGGNACEGGGTRMIEVRH